MNYQDNHAYMEPPAMRPLDMYQVKHHLANQAGMVADSLVNLGQTTNDHALRIDELRNDIENLRAVMMWVAEVHPEVIKQHFALRDIERATK